jgi:riboflavin-specific deaminase-like protein
MTMPSDAPNGTGTGAEHGKGNAQHWADVPRQFKVSKNLLPEPWEAIFGPMRTGRVDDLVVVGQYGQSIDGRIATDSGHSHYINGPDGLCHLHRLRALVDAVVVGVGTAIADDPQLTVRRVAGDSPARVVIDPNGRLPATARLFAGDGVRRLVVTQPETKIDAQPDVELVRLAGSAGQISPPDIVAALSAHGFRRMLIEGGANTVSRFLAAGCLDRLHVIVAPLIVGSGPTSVSLPPIQRIHEALRVPMAVHRLGDEVLLDCDLTAQRIGIGSANKST